jgi:sugar O-acyltransferase (sialic acid O-acetyltransferase NeuD family)
MAEIIIIGASGHAAEIQDYIGAINRHKENPEFRIAGFIDDDPDTYARYQFRAPYLGSIKDHKPKGNCDYIMGIANIVHRKRIIEDFLTAGARFVSVKHPTAYISDSARLGTGCILGPNVNVGPNVSVGDHTLLNSRCSLGHDTVVGKYNFISPNVSLSGGTKVGDENLMGINSATKPGISIGDRNKIEAGMILDRDIGDDTVVFFRYKEKVIAVPK